LFSKNRKIEIYRNIILLMVFLNAVLWKVGVFGRKKEEEAEDCRKLRNEELYYLYFSLNIIRVIKLRQRR
jgi:hypothetical protein